MTKQEYIDNLVYIFEMLGQKEEELEENRKILEQKEEEELKMLLQKLVELLKKQKDLNNQLNQKMQRITMQFEEKIDDYKTKKEIEKEINF